MEDKTYVRILIFLGVIGLAVLVYTSIASALTVCQIPNGCTGTSTAPVYGRVLIGGSNGEYEFVASSTFGSGTSSGFSTTSANYWLTQQTTSGLAEGSNLYWTQTRFDNALSATTSVKSITTLPSLSLPYSQLTGTPDLTQYFKLSDWYATTTDGLKEGSTNLYFTNARADSRFVTDLAATTSVKSITTLSSLSLPYSQLTGAPLIASTTLLSDNNTFSGNDTFNNTVTGSISGNANTATTLQNARTINGVSFNGSSNITINAASSTLLGDKNTWSALNFYSNATSTLFSATNGWITYASTTQVTASTGFCIGSSCITSWPTTGASTTLLSDNNTFSASTTFQKQTNLQGASSTLFEANSTVWLDNTKSAILLTDGNGKVGTYGGTNPCFANQAIVSLSALGVGSCSSTFLTGNQTITLSGDVTGSGATAITTSFALGNSHWWTAAQNFGNASSSQFEATSTVWLDNTKSALLLTDSNGKVGTYGGGTCTNQALTALSALGAGTCGTFLQALGNYATTTGSNISISTSTVTVNGLTYGNTFAVSANGILVTPTVSGTLNNSGLAHSTIVVNSTTLTLGDSGDTITAASSTVLTDNNTFTGKNIFGNASTTLLSVESKLYVGGSATTTIDSSGNIVIPSGSNLTITGKSDGCATFSSGQLNSTGVACGSGGGGAWPFTPSSYSGVANQSTTTPLWLNGTQLIASSTLVVNATTTGQYITSVKSALLLNDSNGQVTAYGGSNPCTNQVAFSISATGVITCTSVANAMLSNSTISGTPLGGTLPSHSHDSTLNGTSYNGSASVSDWGLNTAHANNWTGLQTFTNASSTLFSAYTAFFGGTATSTFNTTGTLFVSTTTPSTSAALYATASTSQNGANLIFNIASTTGTSLFSVNGLGTINTQLTNYKVITTDGSGNLTPSSTISSNFISPNTISGVALGGTLNALSNDGATLSGSSYNGSASVSNWAINLSNQNIWTGASTTITQHLSLNTSSSTQFSSATIWDSTVGNALWLGDLNGKATAYGGAAACTNQFVTAISSLGATTCATVANAALAHSTMVVNSTTLTLGDAGDTITAASSTLLGDNDSFTGTDSFSKLLTLTVGASSTNETISSFFQMPSAANPEPTIKASCSQSTNSPYQIQCGNNAGSTSVYDDRTGISFNVSSTTALIATTSSNTEFVLTGFTATAVQCTITPLGATAEIEWYYTNPASSQSTPIYFNASSTPGIVAISSNNTPATQATSTLLVGNTTGSATAAFCGFYGPITGI